MLFSIEPIYILDFLPIFIQGASINLYVSEEINTTAMVTKGIRIKYSDKDKPENLFINIKIEKITQP